jgi:hypothetical protein
MLKRYRNRLRVLCFVTTLLALLAAGCQTSVNIPTKPATTDERITILPCADDPEGDISFENVTLTTGILEKDYFTPWAGDHKKGEPCFLINGRIVNNSGTHYWVAYYADGYDNSDNRVAGTLDAGPLVGIAQVGLEPRSVEDFTLHLGWSDNATSFTLHSQKSAIMFP